MIGELNPNFDPRKYWAYGCHCFALDDRPMSGMGKGKPIDELDTLCKKYKVQVHFYIRHMIPISDSVLILPFYSLNQVQD